MKKNSVRIKQMIIVAMLTAISLVLYIVGPKFSLPIFPSFLEINFSMLPIFIALFMVGFRGTLAMIVLRFLLKLPFSSTMYVGEIADLILALVTIAPSYLLLIKVNCKGKSVIQFSGILLAWTIAGVISNCFSLPLYMKMFGGKEVIIVAMSMISNVNTSNYLWKYMLFCVVPFNLLLSSVVLAVTFPVNSRLKDFYLNLGGKTKNEKM